MQERAYANQVASAVPLSEIDGQMSRLSNALDVLNQMQQQLAVRLEVVSASRETEAKVQNSGLSAPEACCASPAGERLRNSAGRVEALSSELERILHRLCV